MAGFFPVLFLVGFSSAQAAGPVYGVETPRRGRSLAGGASSATTEVNAKQGSCGAVKQLYKDSACCGDGSKELSYYVIPSGKAQKMTLTTNQCAGKKPLPGTGFDNIDCYVSGVVDATEQAGGDVTAGYAGGLNVGGRTPITEPYWKAGLCPVNVHWHLGAEHRSDGQYDEAGSGPLMAGTPSTYTQGGRRLANVRYGYACRHYDANDARFTTPYMWQHCKDMYVGETYEVHWPHSALGACHTPHQFQTPFYDGVFCGWTDAVAAQVTANAQVLAHAVGVQAQVFTIINDEAYYYPDLMRGAIVDGMMWSDVAAYTGSTTGTSRNNTKCSMYTPITWQVDRKCHLISASTFDKMCADMKQQADDMTDDLHAHGARELVDTALVANNMAAFAP